MTKRSVAVPDMSPGFNPTVRVNIDNLARTIRECKVSREAKLIFASEVKRYMFQNHPGDFLPTVFLSMCGFTPAEVKQLLNEKGN
jgi:hypothetical protein